MSDYWSTRVLLTAVELDLFDELHSPTTAEDVAEALKLNIEGVTRLLNALAALEILYLYEDKYFIRDYLTESFGDGEESILPRLRHRARMWKVWTELPEVLRTGKDYYELKEEDRVDFEDLPTVARALAGSSQRIASVVASRLKLNDVKRILDIGGGPGVYAAAFCDAAPDAVVCIIDRPGITEVVEELLAATDHAEKVTVLEGDALEIDNKEVLGEEEPEKFDLVFMSNLIHSMSAEDIRTLFERCMDWCNPGGKIVVKDYMMDDTRTKPARAAIFAVNMLVGTEGGNTYTWTEVENMLRALKDDEDRPIITGIEKVALPDGSSGMIIAQRR